MAVNCVAPNAFPNAFTETVYRRLCMQMELLPGDHTLIGPVTVNGRSLDGIIITPKNLFLLKTQASSGHIQQVADGAMTIRDEGSSWRSLSDRQGGDVLQQAIGYKLPVLHFLRNTFGVEGLYIQSLLIFPDDNSFAVDAAHRDYANVRALAFILTLDEVAPMLRTFDPPGVARLDEPVQAAMADAFRHGAAAVTPQEKTAVAQAVITPATSVLESPILTNETVLPDSSEPLLPAPCTGCPSA